jgi:tetraacyldisaccharide 4'-kinase
VAIALVDFRNPPYEDQMMPLGTLREPLHALLRADMVVVTKCPEDIKPMDVRLIKSKLNLYPSQEVYFSKMVYRSPLAVFPNQANYQPDLNWLNSNDSILVFTGVAVPMPLIKYLKQFEAKVKVIHFGDHHAFTREDFTFIYENFKKMGGDRRIIITTEKDAMRIINHPYFPHELKKWLFYIPIEVEFLPGDDNFIEHLDTMIQK